MAHLLLPSSFGLIRALFPLLILLLLVVGPAHANGLPHLDQQLVRAIKKAPTPSLQAIIKQAEAGGHVPRTSLSRRALFARALDFVARTRARPEAINVKQADVLISALSLLKATEENEARQGQAQALLTLRKAVWAIYVTPLVRQAQRQPLVQLETPKAGVHLIKRWYNTEQARRLTAFDLTANRTTYSLAWHFIDLDAVTPASSAIAEDLTATDKILPKLVLYLHIPQDARALQQRGKSLAAKSNPRLRVLLDPAPDAVTQCIALKTKEWKATERQGGAKTGEAKDPLLSGKVNSTATPQPVPNFASFCRKRHPALVAEAMTGLLVDPKRALQVRRAVLSDPSHLRALHDAAKRLAREWP